MREDGGGRKHNRFNWSKVQNTLSDPFILLPSANEVLGKIMFYTRFHSVHRGGRGWLPACITGHRHDWGGGGVNIWGSLHLGWSASQGVGRPPPPGIHGILLHTVNKRTVRILLECFLVEYIFSSPSQNSLK